MIVDLDRLVLVQTTKEQADQCQSNKVAAGGPEQGIPFDAFKSLSIHLRYETSYGRANYVGWALVHKDDTQESEPLCICGTFRRPMCAKSTTGDVVKGDSLSVASVYTPPQHRKKGYASRMMVLLHDEISKTATASVLYSDIGHFYAKTVRRHEDSSKALGWTVKSPLQVTWKVDKLHELRDPPASLCIITPEDLQEICSKDAKLLEDEVKASPVSVFALLPTLEQVDWVLERFTKMTSYIMPDVELHSWGAGIGNPKEGGEEWAFAIWACNLAEKSLIIGRLRCARTDQLRVLLSAAKKAAQEYHLEKVEAWNVPEHLIEGTGWVSEERPNHLPALAWYGDGDLPSKWLAEAWAWC